MSIEVNYIAILVAGIAAMVIGFVWYSPTLFGNQWMKLMGHTPESIKKAKEKMGPMYGVSFIATLIMAYVLSHVMALADNFYGYGRVMTGMTSAFWMWLGFVAPVQMTEVIFGGKKWELFGINTGYQLVSMLAMGMVLGYL